MVAAWMSAAAGCGDGTSRWILLRAGAEQTGAAGDNMAEDGGMQDAARAAAADAGMASMPSDAGMLPDAEAFASACSPQVSIDNRTAAGNGALFDQLFPEPEMLVVQLARRVCAQLYENSQEVPPSPPIALVIDDFYGIGEIGITAPVIYIRLSSLHMQSTQAAGEDTRDDVMGALSYLLAIDYELDDENPAAVRWVTEGIAAWVRYREGYTSIDERRAGGAPTNDAQTAGFFFDWLERGYPGAVYRLNQSLDPSDQMEWSEQVFVDITGKDLATLWRDYQASL